MSSKTAARPNAPAAYPTEAPGTAAPVASGTSTPVSAGPSQCQWSPCGSQPTDSVGLGPKSSISDVAAAVAGPSQCLWTFQLCKLPPCLGCSMPVIYIKRYGPVIAMRLATNGIGRARAWAFSFRCNGSRSWTFTVPWDHCA